MNMKRLVVLFMCGAFLAALFGCGKGKKDRYILDGPGMINHPGWDSVTISRSDSYAQHNFYIKLVKTGDGLVVTGELRREDGTVCVEEEGILLPIPEADRIYALEPMMLPDCKESPDEGNGLFPEGVEVLDMAQVRIEVLSTNGRVLNKVDSDSFSIQVYEIVMPFFKEAQE